VVADALLNGHDPAKSLRDWADRVKPGPHVAGYGMRFVRWVSAPTVQPPYGSLGNGGASEFPGEPTMSPIVAPSVSLSVRV
jgi:hypothetical protein